MPRITPGSTFPFISASDAAGTRLAIGGQIDPSFLALLTARDPANRSYSWTAVEPEACGTFPMIPFFRSGNYTTNPAFETSGNPLVPLGSVVKLSPGYFGSNETYTFSDRSAFITAIVNAVSANNTFSWRQVIPGVNGTWTNGSLTGNYSLNFATELNDMVSSVTLGNIYVLYQGYASAWPQITLQTAIQGNATTYTVQNMTISGAYGGNYALTYYDLAGNPGLTTAPIAWNANAAQIQAALNALSGSPVINTTGNNPFNLTFVDAFGDYPILSANTTLLLNDQEWFFVASGGSGNTTIYNFNNSSVVLNGSIYGANITNNNSPWYFNSTAIQNVTVSGNLTITNTNTTYANTTVNNSNVYITGGNATYNNITYNNGTFYNATKDYGRISFTGGNGTGPAYAYTLLDGTTSLPVSGSLLSNPVIAVNETLNLPSGRSFAWKETVALPEAIVYAKSGDPVNGALQLGDTDAMGSFVWRYTDANGSLITSADVGLWANAVDVVTALESLNSLGNYTVFQNITINPNGTSIFRQTMNLDMDPLHAGANLTIVPSNYNTTYRIYMDHPYDEPDLGYGIAEIVNATYGGGSWTYGYNITYKSNGTTLNPWGFWTSPVFVANGTKMLAVNYPSASSATLLTVQEILAPYVVYDATTVADWSGSNPLNVQEALDRIAAAVGPIA